MAKCNIIPIFIPFSGCPIKCVYCDQNRITGASSFKTGEDVREEILEGLHRKGSDSAEAAFYGGTFTMLSLERQTELLSAVGPFIKSGDISSIRLSTRPEQLTSEDFIRLKAAGVKTIEFGIQSIDHQVLSESMRGLDLATMEKTVRLAKSHGLSLGLQQMIGLPEDTYEKDKDTAKWIVQYADFVRIYPTVVFENTALYERYLEGSYRPLSLNKAIAISADLLDFYECHHIPVIRVGLPQMDREDYVEGPYDDNFREFAESKRRVEKLLCLYDSIGEIGASSGEINRIIGPRGYGRKLLEDRFGPIRFNVLKDETNGSVIIKER